MKIFGVSVFTIGLVVLAYWLGTKRVAASVLKGA